MRTLLVSLALLAAACGPAAPPAQNPAAGITVSEAWATPTPGGVDVSAGYMIITNADGEDDSLVGVTSARAGRVQIHTMSMDAGMMVMRELAALPIPAHGQAVLAPGGSHFMFLEASPPFAEGETIAVELTFARAGKVQANLPVHAPGAP